MATRKESSKKRATNSKAEKTSLIERRSLRKRRRTVRMQQIESTLTSVEVASAANKAMLLTRTRIVRKRQEIGVLPIDKNVMIEAGSIDGLARKFGTTKQAIGGWFGRRGLAVQDVVDGNTDRKKEIL